MIIAHIKVSGVTAVCKRRSQIPARLVGGKVVIEYADPVWAELNKTAVFRGAVTRDVVNIGELVEIPPEVLGKVGADVHFGIEGRNADGTLVIPLIEAQLGKVMESTDPSGDPSTTPELPVWQQILDLIGNLNDLTTEAKTTLVAAINEAARRGGGSVDEETVWDIVDEYLKKNPPTVDVPDRLSQFENDAGFITRLVADLENYYAKSQTYTRQEIDGKISAIPKFSIKAVNSLPTTGISETTVYLLSTGSGSDLYTEYIYVDGEWEVLGSQRVDLTGYALKTEIPKNISQLQNDAGYLTKIPDGYAKDEDIPKEPSDIGAQPAGDYALRSEIPSVPVQSVNGQTGKVQLNASDVGALPDTYTPPNQTAQQVGADPVGTATTAVAGHNTDTASHEDIRLELKRIADQLTAFFDSDDKTLDELSEIVAYITSNKSLIDSITTSKVSVSDIVNNLTTNVSNKPLSAAQGVVLKGLIDTLSNSLSGYQPKGDYALRSEIPAVPVKSVNNKTGDVKVTASDVGADPAGTAANAVSAHNQSQEAHPDIRESVRQLSEKNLTMFISPDGNDSNDGLSASTPKKTVKACVNAGAIRISAKRGVYKEIVALSNIGELEIFPTDNDLTYAVGTEREPIVFDTSDSIAVSSLAAYNSIKRVAYSDSANTQFDKVFTKKSQTPIYGDGYGSRYNATIWLLSSDEKTVCIKLKPVLTVAECEAEANTFSYVSGYIYINADMTGVEKIVVPTNWDCGIYINGADRFVLKEVEVRFAGSYNIDIRNCAYFDFYKCVCKYTSYGSGFHPFNSNGRMTACYATKNFDGYGISGYGHTTYVDCVSEFNFDDGMSHHNATTGTVIGGRYEGNGKGGNVPAYGAKVNIYGGLYKGNASFGIGYLWATDLEPASGMVQGAVMVGNPIGLSVQKNCDVTAMNCTYQGNNSDKDTKGNLTEYNANYVKTVNGIKPDENGNVNVEGVEVVPAYTNMLPLAIDTNGSVYNGTGYKNGYRLNSSAVEKQADGSGHTGYIKAKNGDTVRMKNYNRGTEGYDYIHYYDGTFTKVNTYQTSDHFTPDADGMYTLVINSTCEYIRISAGEFTEDTIITVNEEITD